MYLDLERDKQWVQIAIVQGAIRDCGDVDFPGLYIRIDDSSILNFIKTTMESVNGTKQLGKKIILWGR